MTDQRPHFPVMLYSKATPPNIHGIIKPALSIRIERSVDASSSTHVVKKLSVGCRDIVVRVDEEVALKLVRFLRFGGGPPQATTREMDEATAHAELVACLSHGLESFKARAPTSATFFEVSKH
jgi:hypothetical protein